MRHILKLNRIERIEAWLNLCELTFQLMKKFYSMKEFQERLKKLREEHLKGDYIFLTNLGDLDNVKK